MKILRAVNRRGFDVGVAGYFNVLRPNTWFAASRFRDKSRYLSARPEAIAPSDTQNPAAPSLDAKLNEKDPGWVRLFGSNCDRIIAALATHERSPAKPILILG